MPSRDTHFGHRETAGIVVDLFWSHGDPSDGFRVEVQDTRGGDRFVLYPAAGPEAIQAFHHRFASARAARTCQQKRALQRRGLTAAISALRSDTTRRHDMNTDTTKRLAGCKHSKADPAGSYGRPSIA